MTRPLRVKFILPALTEATSPYWRPIKYSLFPPLGLATLAAYLRPDDEAVLVDEHVAPLDTDDAPDLVVIQVYITNAAARTGSPTHYRAKGVFVALGGLHVTSLPDEAAPHADAIFLGPGEQTFPQFLADFRAGSPQRRLSLDRGPHARPAAAGPARSDRSPPLPRAELDRRHARLSAALRLLLQGRVLRGRPIVLHAARGRRARRDRPAAGPASLFPRRSSARRSPLRRGAVRRHARDGPAVPGRRDGRLDSARRSDRAGRGRRPAQPLRRVRDADARQSRAAATSARISAATTRR